MSHDKVFFGWIFQLSLLPATKIQLIYIEENLNKVN